MKKFLSILAFTQLLIISVSAQTNNYVQENYTKIERKITMRDGVNLFTSIYIPKDISNDKKYPILMQRTCYSVAPYGEDKLKSSLGPSGILMKDKYIFVYQDVRGRWMSEGKWTNMTPMIANKKSKKDFDCRRN